MKCSCSLTPILAIVGLVGLGFGGYNMLRTGCPLGMCDSKDTAVVTTAATVVPVAATVEAPVAGECPMKCHGESVATDIKNIKTVAHTSEIAPGAECADAEHCCKGESEACCKGKAESECPMHAAKHEAAAECPHTAVPAKDSGAN